MAEHTQIVTPTMVLPASVVESAVELEEILITEGQALPALQVGDVLCCQIRRRHDVFIVRQVEPDIILGSVARARRINPKEELTNARPIVLIRTPNLGLYPKVVEGGIYQLLTGQELTVHDRRWVEADRSLTPVLVGAIPKVVLRWLPPEPPPETAA